MSTARFLVALTKEWITLKGALLSANSTIEKSTLRSVAQMPIVRRMNVNLLSTSAGSIVLNPTASKRLSSEMYETHNEYTNLPLPVLAVKRGKCVRTGAPF